MATRIHENDLMVLQRPGAYLDTDPNYPGMPGDIDIYNFTGADLKYSCQQYVREDGIFVLKTGDVMSGDLTIAKDNVPSFTLTANMYSTSSSPFSKIVFSNLHGLGGTLGHNIEIKAIGHEPEKMRLTVGQAITIYETGGMSMTHYPVITTRTDDAILAYGEVKGDHETRILWGKNGGALYATELSQVRLKWGSVGGHISSYGKDAILTWGDTLKDGVAESSHVEYNGDIELPHDIITKEWAEELASHYLPLEGGTMVGSIGMDVGSDINALAGHGLELKQNGEIYVTMGKNGGVVDDKIVVEKTINLKENKVTKVKYPTEIGSTNGTTEEEDAVPKKYVDDRDDYLEDKIDNLSTIASPPGMINGFAGNVADEPQGWLICDGRTFSQLKADPKYAGVNFDALKAVLHVSNDSSKIPDLRGRYIGGVDSAANCPLGNVSRCSLGPKTAKPSVVPSNCWMFIECTCHKHCYRFQHCTGSGHCLTGSSTNADGCHCHTITSKLYLNKDNQSQNKGDKVNWNCNSYCQGTANSLCTTCTTSAHKHCIDGCGATCCDYSGGRISNTCWDAETRPKTYSSHWIIKY